MVYTYMNIYYALNYLLYNYLSSRTNKFNRQNVAIQVQKYKEIQGNCQPS